MLRLVLVAGSEGDDDIVLLEVRSPGHEVLAGDWWRPGQDQRLFSSEVILGHQLRGRQQCH